MANSGVVVPGKVTPLDTLDAFTSYLSDAGDKIVLIDFHATWCGPCKQIAPTVEAMAVEMPDVAFCKIDVDVNRQVAAMYKIEAMPTFVYVRCGTQLHKFPGADPNKLRSTLQGLRTSGYDIIPANTTVVIHGLIGSPQHNGVSGVVNVYNAAKGRYVVKIMGSGNVRELSLKRGNLLQTAEVTLLEEEAEETSNRASITGPGDGPGMYTLLKSVDNTSVTLPSSKFVLPAGFRCKIVGLVSASQYNGKVGNIESYDKESGRYLVQVAYSKHLKLKRENVAL